MVACKRWHRTLFRDKHIYRDLNIEFLSTFHVKVTRGPQYQAGYILFYSQGQFYEMNLGIFNNIFGFPPSMDLLNRQVPRKFNRMQFGVNFLGALGTTLVHQSAYILETLALEWLNVFSYSFFPRENSLSVPRLSELYFLSCILDGVQLDPSSF